jgi:hypothetical protein
MFQLNIFQKVDIWKKKKNKNACLKQFFQHVDYQKKIHINWLKPYIANWQESHIFN